MSSQDDRGNGERGTSGTEPRRELWQRRPGETARQYQGFVAYRALGPDRTLSEAARRLGVSVSLVKRWSSRNQWRLRAELWDAHERDQAEEEARTARERAYRRRLEYAEQLEKVAMAGLRSLVVRDPETGQSRFVKGLKPSEIADLIGVACRLLPPSIAELPEEERHSPLEAELSQFSQADLERLNSLLEQERPEERGDDHGSSQ